MASSVFAARPTSRRRWLPPVPDMARDVVYLAAGLPIGIASFTVAVGFLSFGLGSVITIIGIPVLIGMLVAARWFAWTEVARARWLLGQEREALGDVWGRPGTSWWERTKETARARRSWTGLIWSFLLFGIGIAGFVAAVTAWSVTVGMLLSPLWWWVNAPGDQSLALLDSNGLGWNLVRVLIGVALVPVTAWGLRGLARGTAHLATKL
jgi:hypothetical protein